ncbi:glycosyltransferase family 9 protein [Rasiella sp. SM2506]|uniref:glycosyltransferase family 9 protein n=1 Tax=Rasiella sp. SM2506 TaxID=3423914 RepID=UPI003D7A036A
MKQILVIQNKRIGDVLISSVLANNLKKRFPESTITYLVYPYTAGVLEHNPNIDHIWKVDETWLKNLPNLLKMIARVRRKKFDIIFDPYAKFQSRMICYFSGAEYRIGFKRPGKKLKLPFYSHPVHFIPKRTQFCGKAIENRLNLLNSVFPMEEMNDTPKIYITEEEASYDRIKHLKKPVIMLGVLGSTPQKSMPYEYVAQLIDYIAENYNASLLFNYAPYQKAEAEAIYNLCEHKDQIHLDIYEDSIRGFITLMNKCDLLISNEGGSVHIAKALDKPTFTIYSPYIEKEDWNSFEDGVTHQSVHLLDFKPELYESFTREERKAIEADPSKMYHELTPALILSSLKPYLKHHLAT